MFYGSCLGPCLQKQAASDPRSTGDPSHRDSMAAMATGLISHATDLVWAQKDGPVRIPSVALRAFELPPPLERYPGEYPRN